MGPTPAAAACGAHVARSKVPWSTLFSRCLLSATLGHPGTVNADAGVAGNSQGGAVERIPRAGAELPVRPRFAPNSSSPPCTSSASPHAAPRPRPDSGRKHRAGRCSTLQADPIPAAKSGARDDRPGRNGCPRLRRFVPAQQFLYGRTQRPSAVASSWASSLARPHARLAHPPAWPSRPPRRRHDRRRASLRANSPRPARATPAPRALAAAIPTSPNALTGTRLPGAGWGLTAMAGSMHEARRHPGTTIDGNRREERYHPDSAALLETTSRAVAARPGRNSLRNNAPETTACENRSRGRRISRLIGITMG